MIILSGIIYFVIVFLMLMGWKYRKLGIFAWRTGCAVSMLRVIQICLTPDPLLVLNEAYTFQLMIIGFIIMPLLPQVSVCDSCGRRIYWRPLFRSRCSHCGEKLYWQQPAAATCSELAVVYSVDSYAAPIYNFIKESSKKDKCRWNCPEAIKEPAWSSTQEAVRIRYNIIQSGFWSGFPRAGSFQGTRFFQIKSPAMSWRRKK